VRIGVRVLLPPDPIDGLDWGGEEGGGVTVIVSSSSSEEETRSGTCLLSLRQS
jgi:hypothetical protein